MRAASCRNKTFNTVTARGPCGKCKRTIPFHCREKSHFVSLGDRRRVFTGERVMIGQFEICSGASGEKGYQ